MTIKVDLKSQEVKRGFTFDYGWVVWLLFVLLISIGFVIYGQNLDNKVKSEKANIDKNDKEIAKYANIKPAIERLQRDIGAIQGQITQLQELRYDYLKYAVILTDFTALLPPSIWINSFALEPGRNSITFAATALAGAESPPLKAIGELMRNIQNSPHFGSVNISNVAEVKEGGQTVFNVNVEAGYRLSIADLKGSERP